MGDLHRDKLEDDFKSMSYALSEMSDRVEKLHRIIKWFLNGNTGMSSKTIVAAVTGIPYKDARTPADPSDFKRCSELLKTLGMSRDSILEKVLATYPDWGHLCVNWDELEEILEGALDRGDKSSPELYERIKALTSKEKRVRVYWLLKRDGEKIAPFATREHVDRAIAITSAETGIPAYKFEVRESHYTLKELETREDLKPIRMDYAKILEQIMETEETDHE